MQAYNHLDKADTFDVDATFADADADDYDGLVLPGGVANPDALRLDEDAVAFVKAFFDATSRSPRSATRRGRWSRPTSCAGGPSPRGRACRPTCATPAPTWKDEEVVVDGNLVTSRKPDDLPAFNEAAIAAFSALSGRDRRGA